MAPELPGDLAERGTLPQARPATLPVPAAEWTVPPSDQRSPYQLPWDWWDFLAISLLWLAFVVLSGPIVFAVLGEPDTAADPRYIIASNLQITIVLLGWVMARSRPIGVLRGWRLLLGPKQLTWNDVGWGVIHGVIGWVMVTFALGSLLELLAGALGRELPAVQEQLQDVVRADRTALLTGIATILVAPLVEELMFRGVLLHGLYRRLPAWPAAALTGLVFALYHGEVVAVILLLPFGVYLARIVQRRGSVVTAIVAHMTFNAAGVVLLRTTAGAG